MYSKNTPTWQGGAEEVIAWAAERSSSSSSCLQRGARPIGVAAMASLVSLASSLTGSRYADGLVVVGISFCTAVLCEIISWILIYRTSSYKSLRSSIDKASKKLETMKNSSSSSGGSASVAVKKSSKNKKMDRVESSLKESTRDLSLFKFKSGAVVAVVLFVVFGLLNSLFDGKPVAKLPFAPVSLVYKMSHRGLPGSDPTDCSMAFLYLLCSVSIRTNLQKFLGFSPPRGAAGASLFPVPDPKLSWWTTRIGVPPRVAQGRIKVAVGSCISEEA